MGHGERRYVSAFLALSSLPTTCASELQTTIQFEPGFTAIMIHHPDTYLNKVLVASSQGNMQLWNIRTQYAPLPFSCIYPCSIVLPER